MSAHSTSPSTVTPLRIHKHQIDPELAQYSDSEPSTVSDNSTNSSLTGRRPYYEYPAMEERKGSPAPAKQPPQTEREEAPTTPPFSASGPQQKSASPRTFWQSRDSKDGQQDNLNVHRRSSIERLKKASRVQNNSKLFQQQDSGQRRPLSHYGPASTTPAAAPRPNSRAGNTDRSRLPVSSSSPKQESGRGSPAPVSRTPPPPKVHTPPPRTSSPIKSSLLSSYKTNAYNDETIITTPRNPARRPKSVTFDKEGPDVQEFELITPEPSIDGSPGDRYDSEEDESSDEEYDLDCAPVMEPDGWRMTPEREIPPHITDDPYRSTPSPNGSRPLPPLPGMPNRSDSASPGGSRPLPTVPLDLRHTGRMSLEERMDLMSLHQPDSKDRRHSEDLTAQPHSHEELREETPEADRVSARDSEHDHESDDEESDDTEVEAPKPAETRRESDSSAIVAPPEYQMSRNNIRRQLEERRDSDEGTPTPPVEDFARQRPQFRTERLSDVPPLKRDETSDEDDMYAITDYALPKRPSSRFATRFPDPEIEPSEASTYNDADDEYSHYSDTTTEVTEQSLMSDREHSSTPIQKPQTRLSLTDAPVLNPSSPASSLSGVLENDGSRISLRVESRESTPKPADTRSSIGSSTTQGSGVNRRESGRSDASRRESGRSFTSQDDAYLDDEDTGSVIRHPIDYSDESSEFDSEYDEDDSDTETETRRSPSPVPEATATIRAPGSMLKTRASATPADIQAMAAARRQVSGDVSHLPPPAPRIPTGYRSEGEAGSSESDSEDTEGPAAEDEHSDGEAVKRRISGRRMVPTLPVLGEFEFDLKLDDLNEEFDKVIEKQKRGYLMRQNTKVIHASSQDMDDEAPSELNRPGHARGKSWSVEPWRAAGRRRSHRDLNSSSSRKRNSNVGTGPVPPLPGQESVSRRLPSVSESDGRSSLASADAETGERGRLFVKVVGVKDLGLPFPQGEPAQFCLTLDNGLHCVTTSWLELAKNAPIGQEFELVVLDDLEFQLTLQVKMDPPPPPTPAKPASKAPAPVKIKEKKSAFSKLLTSPKKKRLQAELEAQRLQQQQEQEQAARRNQSPPKPATPWELYHSLVGRDGSFARSYISLKDFESHAYGRPFTTDVPCFNEWAVDAASVKSKKGVQHLQPARKAPYKIGKLELQLFFVPRPKNATENDLPKSMSAAIRELKEADAILNRTHEGILSQQGGDCPFWRRRYFKLDGSRLTAYHEVSRQPRATINLSKASKLIDDRKTLIDPTVSGPGKTRRKSGFSEEEEGYMMVDFGFRIRFGNGEVIDFYADSAVEKAGWMKILNETVGRVPDSRGWCQLVLQREQKRKAEQNAARMRAAQQQHPRPSMGISSSSGRPSMQGGAAAGNRLSMAAAPPTSSRQPPMTPRTNPNQRPMSYAGPSTNQGPRQPPNAHVMGNNRMSTVGPYPGPQARRPPVNFR
ncbi:DUF1709-domain-containing protein [Ascodesmis nigricans]|uniref:DUF1709-domain-containing protein n=1 Tax=Ascodesmis nigricans TaxID=341454 RepID=A0A4S2MLH3_9PEZI|nr:DUF1709-domain-containing protein [Ascodesmis nigricans]